MSPLSSCQYAYRPFFHSKPSLSGQKAEATHSRRYNVTSVRRWWCIESSLTNLPLHKSDVRVTSQRIPKMTNFQDPLLRGPPTLLPPCMLAQRAHNCERKWQTIGIEAIGRFTWPFTVMLSQHVILTSIFRRLIQVPILPSNHSSRPQHSALLPIPYPS
jgi:hypothetical protein